MFNSYSSSRHPTKRVDPLSISTYPSSQRQKEDNSDDSHSSSSSSPETVSPSPHFGTGVRSKGDRKIHSKASSILTRPSLDTYHGSSDPSGLSKLKSQQPWVAEPSGYKEKKNSPQSPRSKGTDPNYLASRQGSVGGYLGEAGGGTSGQPQSWTGSSALAAQQPTGRQPEYTFDGSSRIPDTERDHHASNIPTERLSTTVQSSRSPPNPTTSIPRRKEEDSPTYNPQGSGWGREGSSQPADPSSTKPYGQYSPTDTTQLQYEAPHSHASQVQGSSGSRQKGITWVEESLRPSDRDLRSNPSVGPTESHPWGGQPLGPPAGWSANPLRRVSFLLPLHQIF